MVPFDLHLYLKAHIFNIYHESHYFVLYLEAHIFAKYHKAHPARTIECYRELTRQKVKT